MRAFVFGAVLGLLLAAPAWAGDGAAPPDKIADPQIAAAMDLLDANHSIDNISAMLDAMAPLQAMQIRQQDPSLTVEQIALLQSTLKSELLGRIGELKLIVAKAYAAHFSEDELHTLAAFYRSDTGKKYVETVPVMLKELAPTETAWVMGVALDAAKRMSGKAHHSGDPT